ncbi:MAG TPA: hypothetical protein VMV86_02355 [Methanosarcinales archaeon]|nr:hypothetical protein [Methanosarcinales archaeon]
MEFVSFSNEELEKKPKVKLKSIKCGRCGKIHKLEAGKYDDGRDSDLLFYNCGKKSYLYSLAGRVLF